MSHLEVASKSLKAVQQLAMLEGLPEGAAPASALDTGETSSETIEEIQQGIRNLLPDALRDAIYGRRSKCYAKTYQYFLRFCDDRLSYPSDSLWRDLSMLGRYLQLHLYTFCRETDISDAGPMIMYQAGVPDLLLRAVKLSLDSSADYFRVSDASSVLRCLPHMAIVLLGYFMHPTSPTFVTFSERLFRGMKPELECIVDVAQGKLSWIDSFAAVRFFSTASDSANCCFWTMGRPDVVQVICKYLHSSSEIVQEKINRGEITKRNKHVSAILTYTQASSRLDRSAQIMGRVTISHAAIFMCNVLRYSLRNYEWFLATTLVVRRANVMAQFCYTVKQLFMLLEPDTGIMSYFESIRYLLDVRGGVEALVFDDTSYCEENSIPRGITGLQFWTHASLFPSRLSIVTCIALSLNCSIGFQRCTDILLHILDTCLPDVITCVVDVIGAELMDLAHLLEWWDFTIPLKAGNHVSVQNRILEALLRHAGFSYKQYDTKDTIEGKLKDVKNIPECCLEAALYSHRATLEAKMPLAVKQDRVREADVKKDQGNRAFKESKFEEASALYTEAMALCPLSARPKHAVYYRNRAECHLRLNKPMRAVHDCNRSLCLDHSMKVKVQWRRSRAYQKLGLVFPAWLDMKSIESKWTEQPGVDFKQMLATYSTQVGFIGESSGKPFWQ